MLAALIPVRADWPRLQVISEARADLFGPNAENGRGPSSSTAIEKQDPPGQEGDKEQTTIVEFWAQRPPSEVRLLHILPGQKLLKVYLLSLFRRGPLRKSNSAQKPEQLPAFGIARTLSCVGQSVVSSAGRAAREVRSGTGF